MCACRQILVTVALTIVIVTSCTPSLGQTASNTPALLSTDIESLSADLAVSIPELIEEADVPGISTALIRDGRIVWTDAYGVMNRSTKEVMSSETVLEAASLTKPVFAYLVMLLVEERIIDLDAPLVEYLPQESIEELITHPIDKTGFRWDWFEKITARQVLSHSSGMPHGEAPEPYYRLFFEPGTDYRYSAAGYRLLQLAVEKITDQSLPELARRRIFDPLGMGSTRMIWHESYEATAANGHGFLGEPEPHRKFSEAHAAASMYTTASDYAAFMCALMNRTLLGEKITDEMLTAHIDVDESIDWSLGFGLQKDDNGTAIWQWGDYGIYRNFAIAYPDSKIGVVYLTNSFNGLSIGPEMLALTIGGASHALSWLDYDSYDSPRPRFLRSLTHDGTDAALELLARLNEEHPDEFNEGYMNRLGYGLLSVERYDDAVTLFKWNSEKHPESANAYDSLAEAYERRDAKGDIELAIANYKKAVRAIPDDDSRPEVFKHQLRENAEAKIIDLNEKRRERMASED